MDQLKTLITYTVVFVVVFAGLYFEPYKFQIFHERMIDHKPYEFFYWARNKITSLSDPTWLTIHLASALSHILFSAYMFLWYNKKLFELYRFSHLFFCFVIIMNLNHAGDLDPYKAMLFNGAPLLVAILTFDYEPVDKEQKSWLKNLAYFVSVSSAIIFETVKYMQEQ